MNPRTVLAVILSAIASSTAHTAAAQTDTTFTYQGSLTDAGSPATGTYEIQARLYNALTGGSQIGPTQIFFAVPVDDGVFTIQPDFGADAFSGSRWLELVVNSTIVSPRQPVTRSPYSIQTRGMFVNQAGDIGMGTSLPEGKLHVRDGSAGSVTAQASSSAVFERAGNNFLSILSPNDTERGILFGDPESFVNGGIVYNNPSTPDGFEFRTNGNQKRMVIDADGRLGVGTPSPVGFAQMTAVGASAGQSAIYALNGTSSAATIRIDNVAQGYALQAESATDVSAAGGGIVIVGEESTANVAIDQNEIMARNNGQASTLLLNAEGGDVRFGPQRTTPAFAFGKVASDGSVISASQNISYVIRTGEGRYSIGVAGGASNADVVVTTSDWALRNSSVEVLSGEYRVYMQGVSTEDPIDSEFSFVVFRP